MRYLITGGTGSFGSHFVEWLYKNTCDEIVVYSRGEERQWEMKHKYPKVKYIIGDVRDYDSLIDAVVGCDYVIHAAALKHVSTGENYPQEVIKTNILGTENAVRASNNVGAKMVLISTDKGVQPINLYGATKMVAERLTLNGNQRVVRWGNVFGSSGSILHIFKEQAAFGSMFTITDRRMTRFVITFRETIDVVLSSLKKEGGTITIPENLRAIRIIDLAYAFDENAKFNEIGIQQGEKISEVLLTSPLTESEDCYKMSIEEIRDLINETLY